MAETIAEGAGINSGGSVPRNAASHSCRPHFHPRRDHPHQPAPLGATGEFVRNGDRVRQRILHHIGVAMDDDELARLKQLAGIRQGEVDRRAAADPVPAGAAGGDGHRSGAPGRRHAGASGRSQAAGGGAAGGDRRARGLRVDVSASGAGPAAAALALPGLP